MAFDMAARSNTLIKVKTKGKDRVHGENIIHY
jgi:hypothetical protein